METESVEYVKQTMEYSRKRAIRTKLVNFVINKIWKVPIFYSESRAEGISSVQSDTDFMFEADGIFTLSNEGQIGLKSDTSVVYVVMDTHEVHSGYTRIQIMEGDWNDLSEFASSGDGLRSLCKTFGNHNSKYLSNILVKQFWETRMKSVIPRQGLKNEISSHGPSTVIRYAADKDVVEVDTLICLRGEWPEVAKEWLERKRNFNWPTKELIEEIKAIGCNLVPIGHRLSHGKELELEWRISFSKAECLLIWSLNGTQTACIECMRLFFQVFISPKFPDLFSSYFIKTAMFWLIEETDSTFWQPLNILACLDRLLSKLITCVEEKCIQNFFIPKNNMLDAKAVESKELLDVLRIELTRHDVTGEEKWRMLIKEKLLQMDKNDIYYYHILINSLSVSRHFIYNSIRSSNIKDSKDMLMQGIQELKCCNDKDMFSDVCKQLQHELEAILSIVTFCESQSDSGTDRILSPNDTKWVEETLNKYTELSHSTGKLLLCTFYFYIERYQEALAITEDVQTRYTSQVVHYTFWNRSKTPRDDHYPQITPRPTLNETLKNYIALDVVLLPCLSRLFRATIQEKLYSRDALFIHPLFYAFFVRFHCFYRMQNAAECEAVLNKMQTFVAENMDVLKTTQDFNILHLGDSCHQLLKKHTESGNYFKKTIKSLLQKGEF
ncbi:hypothetical protein CHS0354_016781 [Potamilus streckersoni]|uniref:Mab-21-like HhH/H2TH-like domain-containing protein n=1 Tax=Potamilus streckersoni TaxID=2493646 RepID=A0AAE0W669_9BIVA|nr:hypothetical protein CHS0354_016781 [Potamilus streckersoni]